MVPPFHAATRALRGRREERRAQRHAEPRGRAEPAWVVPALTAVFLISGAAGLIHEVVWGRILARVFGASSLAVSTVLAAYMGGLALGSWWIGTRLGRIADRRRTYALLEIAIGVLALAVPLLLRLVEPVYGALWRRFQFSFATFTALRFLLAGALLAGPTILMGATLPVLADYFAGLRGRRVAPPWLYTANLVGAVLGVAGAGFVLMPRLGLRGTILVGAAVNVAAGFAVLAFPHLGECRPPQAAGGTAARHRPRRLLLGAALASGIMSLATQVAWTRVLVLIVGSSTYAFSSVLLVTLFALAAGSVWGSSRGLRVADVLPDLSVVHLLFGLCTLGSVWAVDRLPLWYVVLFEAWQPESNAATVVLNTVVAFAVLILPMLCAGTILPLALSGALPREAGDTGAVVGTVYAINTVGAIAGALLAGFVLLPALGSQSTLLGVGVTAALLGVVFAFASERRRALGPAAAGVSILLLAASLLEPPWQQIALNAGVYEPHRLGSDARQIVTQDERLVYHREGRTATVVVIEREGRRSLRINGRINASESPADMLTQILLAQLPLLLAPRTEDVFILGWGSGITAGAALQAPVRRVTAVEIEPAVIEASDFFRHVNHDARRDPRLTLFADDARHLLRASQDTYDVMISEPSHPWITGVADLFTQDFFALAARRLRADGLFAQWLQGYQISLDTFHSILYSFHAVFPHVLVFEPPESTDYVLVGSHVPIRIDLAALHRRWAHEETRAENARIGLDCPEHLLVGIRLSPERVAEITHKGRLNTDDNMYVEFHAPRDMHVRYGPQLIAAFIRRFPTPIESVLTEPSALLGDADRLEALIAGLARWGRDTDEYAARLATLR